MVVLRFWRAASLAAGYVEPWDTNASRRLARTFAYAAQQRRGALVPRHYCAETCYSAALRRLLARQAEYSRLQ